MRYCPSCGTQLSSETTQCPTCGATIPAYYSNMGPTPNAPTVVSSPYSTPQPPSTSHSPEQNPVTLQSPYGMPSSSSHTPSPHSFSPNTPPSLPAQRWSNRTGIVVGVILLLLLLAGSGVFIYARSSAQKAALQTTATAGAAASNPYTHTGTLAFSDPLSDNNKGHGWSEYAINCAFKAGAYHAMAPNPNYSDYCFAKKTNLSNFTFEVQMQVIQGDGGGIVFRGDTSTGNNYYQFIVRRDGRYSLSMVKHNQVKNLARGTSLAINQRPNQINLLAAVVQGTSIKVYVNHELIASQTDSTFSHGQIGVEAITQASNGHPTEVVYSNLKVWELPQNV